MKIHVNRDRQTLGVFTPEELRQGYDSGRFLPSDLVWREGMESWKALGEVIDELAPAAASVATIAPAGGSAWEPAEGDGPAWEKRASMGFLSALFETIRQVLFEPVATFQNLKTSGGLGSPLFFYVVVGTVTSFIGLLFQMFANTVMPAQDESAKLMAAALGSAVALGVTIMVLPVLVAIGAFVSAAILHLMLMLVAGVRDPFEKTFRITAYASGASSIFQLLPVCGGLVYGIYNLLLLVKGLSIVYRLSTGKAVIVVLLPSILCCGLGLMFMGAIFAAAVGSGAVGDLPR